MKLERTYRLNYHARARVISLNIVYIEVMSACSAGQQATYIASAAMNK
jgi:hypothetical protein